MELPIQIHGDVNGVPIPRSNLLSLLSPRSVSASPHTRRRRLTTYRSNTFFPLRPRETLFHNRLLSRYASYREVEMEDSLLVYLNEAALVPMMVTCAELKNRSFSRQLHQIALKNGLHLNGNVATAMFNMYSKCGCIDTAGKLFDEMPQKDVFSWTAMISGLVAHGRFQEAVEVFLRMRDEGEVEPNATTITKVINASAQLRDSLLGKELHGIATKKGLHHLKYVGTALVDMYAKCGSIDAARKIFDEMLDRDLVSWNTMIMGLVDRGLCEEAVELFLSMRELEGVEPDEKTITKVTNACAQLEALSFGKGVHGIATKKGIHFWNYVANALLDMYAKCGCIDVARKLFDRMLNRDVVSWNAMISGLVDHGQSWEALELFLRMRDVDGVEPDDKTITKVIKACVQIGELSFGKGVHGIVMKKGLHRWINVGNSLLSMYAKCGCIDAAQKVFDEMFERNVISWNAMITGLVGYGRCREALKLLSRMRDVDGVELNEKTITKALQLCANLGKLSLGKEMHEVAKRKGFHCRTYVANALLDMYAKCGCIDSAWNVFHGMMERDVISWNTMIGGLVNHGQCQEAVELFPSMVRGGEGVEPDQTTLSKLLQACAQLGDLSIGKELHGFAYKIGLHRWTYVANSLLNMYAKSGSIDDAGKVFDGMLERDVVSWTAMITGLVDHGQCEEALELLLRTRDEDEVELNEKTIAKLLRECAKLGRPSLVKEVQAFAKKKGIHRTYVANALLDVHNKFQSADAAREELYEMLEKGMALG